MKSFTIDSFSAPTLLANVDCILVTCRTVSTGFFVSEYRTTKVENPKYREKICMQDTFSKKFQGDRKWSGASNPLIPRVKRVS